MDNRCTCHDTLVVKNLNRWFKEKWVDVSRKDKDGKHPGQKPRLQAKVIQSVDQV